MNEIARVEYLGKRVLTTKQLAEFYGTTEEVIRQNFSRNVDRYQEGIHYFKLTGAELKAFKGVVTNCHICQNSSILTLWTEKGAFNHAKSLGNDKAWDVYNMLVDTYYRVKEQTQLLPQDYPSALRALADQVEANQKLLPKAESFDSLMNSEGNLSIKEASEILNFKGIGRNNLFKVLREEKIIFGNYVYQEHVNAGRFVVKVITIDIGDKSEPRSQIFVTPKGLEWLDKYLQKQGYEKASNTTNCKIEKC